MVYTPVGGSPTINVMVYSHYGGLPKLKVNPFTLFFYLVVKIIKQQNKSLIRECVGVIVITTRHQLYWNKLEWNKLTMATKDIT